MSSSPRPTLPLKQIRVGKRHRRDMGDIAGLAQSIADTGLLHDVVVTPDGTLIAGERRLRAFELLGRTEIPVKVVDLDSVVRGEFAENTHRKDFTLSEAVAIKRALEPLERKAAKERQKAAGRERGRGKIASGKLPQSNGRAGDKAAKATGKARRTLEKAEAVVAAAEREPAKFNKLLADMDRTGRVNAPFKRLRVMQQAAPIRAEPPPLPSNGPYRVAAIDIPWAYEPEGNADRAAHRGAWPYPTINIEQASALDVASIMHEDSIIWVWVTNFILVRGLHVSVLHAWGFEPKTLLTWEKDRMGHGDLLRGQSEHAVMAMRGKPVITLTNQTTVLRAPVREHSQKPPEFYDLVESLCPAPRYADLFSRYRHNDRWDVHGDEAPALGRNHEGPTTLHRIDAPATWDGLDIPEYLRRGTS